MANETLLTITGPGVMPFSARGLVQTYAPIAAAVSIRRTINGEARNLALDQFAKYRSTISCTDAAVPALDGVWPGQVLTIGWVAELCYPTSSAPPGRTAVAGSEYEDSGFTFYRPEIDMIVVGYEVSFDEYGKRIGWTLEVEEV